MVTATPSEPSAPSPTAPPLIGSARYQWSKDTSRFGLKLLGKMGWTPGKGLGANEDGRTTNIRARRHEAQSGVGAALKPGAAWAAPSAVSSGLNDVLSKLAPVGTGLRSGAGERHNGRDEGENETTTVERDGAAEAEQKRRKEVRGFYARKRARKQVSSYSKEELREIFGRTGEETDGNGEGNNDDKKDSHKNLRGIMGHRVEDKPQRTDISSGEKSDREGDTEGSSGDAVSSDEDKHEVGKRAAGKDASTVRKEASEPLSGAEISPKLRKKKKKGKTEKVEVELSAFKPLKDGSEKETSSSDDDTGLDEQRKGVGMRKVFVKQENSASLPAVVADGELKKKKKREAKRKMKPKNREAESKPKKTIEKARKKKNKAKDGKSP